MNKVIGVTIASITLAAGMLVAPVQAAVCDAPHGCPSQSAPTYSELQAQVAACHDTYVSTLREVNRQYAEVTSLRHRVSHQKAVIARLRAKLAKSGH